MASRPVPTYLIAKGRWSSSRAMRRLYQLSVFAMTAEIDYLQARLEMPAPGGLWALVADAVDRFFIVRRIRRLEATRTALLRDSPAFLRKRP
jgi:hypothetical protein